MSKSKITAAVVIIDSDGNVLGCHATGRPKNTGFDFPKGLVDEGESDVQAALRELFEETGLTLTEEQLVDAGVYPHNKEKDIHLFIHKTDNMPDVTKLCCTSFFSYIDKSTGEEKTLPECNAFEIISPEEREQKFNRVLHNKFKIIDEFNQKL